MLNYFTYLLETPYWLLQNSSIGNKYHFVKKFYLVNGINQIVTHNIVVRLYRILKCLVDY